MLYDDDNYLNGLDPYVHPGYTFDYPDQYPEVDYFSIRKDLCFMQADYLPIPRLWGCEFVIQSTTLSKGHDNPQNYLPGYHPWPINYEIFKLWNHAKQECKLQNEDIDINLNNSCLNKRFGRPDEPNGAESCRTYYFWSFEVKSRPCMIKNAKLEELDLYQICGVDDAFLCTKASVIEKAERFEKSKIATEKWLEEKQKEEAKRNEETKLFHSDPNNTMLLNELWKDIASQRHICHNNGECNKNTVRKNDYQCSSYYILGVEIKSKYCMTQYALKDELSLYECCAGNSHFICLKGSFKKYKHIVEYNIKNKFC